MPSRNLLLQTRLVDHVSSMRPNIYIGKVDRSAMFRRWYFEATIDHIETVTHLEPHFRVGWANTKGIANSFELDLKIVFYHFSPQNSLILKFQILEN